MNATKAHIMAQLQKEILPLQGFKAMDNRIPIDIGLGPIKDAFPNKEFPLAAIHEFCCTQSEDASATSGFIAGILSSLMKKGGVSLWISSSRTLFPPALKAFGISPEKIIFIDLSREKDVLWAMEEALKCKSLAAVIGEIRGIDFISSRRLQLAVEQSRVTGFIIRSSHNLTTTASLTRWKITSIPSSLPGDMPGVGFPRWSVELIKVRNGKPGIWQIEWNRNKYRHIETITTVQQELRKKAG